MHFRLLYLLICVLSYRFSSAQQLVSRHKNITASSKLMDWVAGRAVDGNTNRGADTCSCCAATKYQRNPWYKLDLGQQYKIYNISVLGRGADGDKGYGQTLKNMQIKLGTTESNGQEIIKYTGNGYTYNYTLPTQQEGRYLDLTLLGIRTIFVICELSVYADCEDGKYGADCQNTCGRCKNGKHCDTRNGTCSECMTGYKPPLCQECSYSYYGYDCSQRCFCVNEPCDKATGICPTGRCTEGYKGDKCNTLCRNGTYGQGCRETCGQCYNNEFCNHVDGHCTRCAAGYKGVYCKKDCDSRTFGLNCSQECGQCLNSAQCNKVNGSCPAGCDRGFKGALCNSKCEYGKYGQNCEEDCGSCYNEVTCGRFNGRCQQCAPGYKGVQCKQMCRNGTYGQGCTETCGQCYNNEVCNHVDGHCTRCEAGYKGVDCKKENTELNAQYSEAKIYQLATAIVGTIAVVSIIGNVMAAICYVILQRRKHKDKPMNSPPDISSSYQLANRGAFETEHQYGQTTPVYEEPEALYEIAN